MTRLPLLSVTVVGRSLKEVGDGVGEIVDVVRALLDVPVLPGAAEELLKGLGELELPGLGHTPRG